MTALPPRAAIALAVRLLGERGYRVRGRNERGDSLYLAPDGSALRLRLSNHARNARQRRKHAEVLASLVIDRPRSAAQVETLVETAIRDFSAARARVDAGAPAYGSVPAPRFRG